MKRFILVIATLFLCVVSFAKTDPYDLTAGPWVTNVTDSSFTVLWTTAKTGIAFVDVVEGDLKGSWFKADKKRVYQRLGGRYYPCTLHTVTVNHLKPGTRYRYRIGGKQLIDQIDPYEYTYGFERYSAKPYEVTTFDSHASTCSFSAVNDMHLMVEKYSNLIQTESTLSKDFILLNGDIITAGDYSLDSLIYYNLGPLGKLTQKLPVMFVKGNHEGRGNVYEQANQIYPTSTREYYYTFRQGPVAFLVLDAGETGYEPSIGFSGAPAYVDYLQEQLEWAGKAVSEPSFASAPVKVCLIHVPMIGNADSANYSTLTWMAEYFVPFLNSAGIDLMVSAHKHVFSLRQPGELGNNFPIFVNSNHDRLEFEADAHSVHIRTYGEDGKESHSFDLSL